MAKASIFRYTVLSIKILSKSTLPPFRPGHYMMLMYTQDAPSHRSGLPPLDHRTLYKTTWISNRPYTRYILCPSSPRTYHFPQVLCQCSSRRHPSHWQRMRSPLSKISQSTAPRRSCNCAWTGLWGRVCGLASSWTILTASSASHTMLCSFLSWLYFSLLVQHIVQFRAVQIIVQHAQKPNPPKMLPTMMPAVRPLRRHY